LGKVCFCYLLCAHCKLKERYEADCIKVNGFIAQQNMLMGKELEKVAAPNFPTLTAEQRKTGKVPNGRTNKQYPRFDFLCV